MVDALGSVPVILRPGAVTPEMIAMVAGECRLAESAMRALRADESAPSPGMRHKHYAPRARMSLVQGSPEVVRAALLALSAGSRERTWVLALDDVLEGHSAAGLKSLAGGKAVVAAVLLAAGGDAADVRRERGEHLGNIVERGDAETLGRGVGALLDEVADAHQLSLRVLHVHVRMAIPDGAKTDDTNPLHVPSPRRSGARSPSSGGPVA